MRSATHTCWDGIKTVTFRNDADKLRLDVLSDVTHGGAIFQMTVARFDNEIEPVFEIEVIDDDEDDERIFALEDEMKEIGNDIIDTKDILEHKIIEGAPQAELKRLAEYIVERNREYAEAFKAAYGKTINPDNIDSDADKLLANLQAG